MSKLAHSNDETMRQIEDDYRAREERGERFDPPDPKPLFTADDDFVKRATIRHWFQAGPGSLVQTPDGRMWTVVYNNLDGWGVVEGDQPKFINVPDEKLIEPTHMLREPYASARLQCIGELVRIFRRVKPDGSITDHRAEIERPAP